MTSSHIEWTWSFNTETLWPVDGFRYWMHISRVIYEFLMDDCHSLTHSITITKTPVRYDMVRQSPSRENSTQNWHNKHIRPSSNALHWHDQLVNSIIRRCVLMSAISVQRRKIWSFVLRIKNDISRNAAFGIRQSAPWWYLFIWFLESFRLWSIDFV